VPDEMELESKLTGLDPSTVDGDQRPRKLCGFACPDCSGPLYEIQDGQLIRYRCRMGHVRTADSMLVSKSEALENALYVALNALEESAAMTEKMAARARARARARGGALRGAGAGGERTGGDDPAGS
jgi:two-component system, chemotaxis family, protein-glutamate methylesterase/glutaminase